MQVPAIKSELCDYRCIHEDRVGQVNLSKLLSTDLEILTRLFKAMGDPNRLRILWALKESEMCVCDIAAFLKVSESAVSHQLRILKLLALVTSRREGTIVYYRLNDDHVSQLIHLALEHIQE